MLSHPFVGSSPRKRNRMCAEALLVVWSDLREKFVEKLLGNSDCDRDYFGFKAWFLPEQKNADENVVVFFVYRITHYIYFMFS